MKKIRELKNTRGITLIALIVTIIVLLILAGVTIATLTGENGIITRAGGAKEETRGAEVQEQVDLWKIQQESDEINRQNTAKTIEDFVADLVDQGLLKENEKDQIIGNSDKGIDAQYRITIGSKDIVFKELDRVLEKLRVGDYVGYKPENSNYTLSSTYSGYDTEQSFSTEDLGWRVLNINENGTVDLISNKPTTVYAYLKGVNGYNNGVYLLNEMCSVLYSNSSKNATARSLNIEDIQDKIADPTIYTNYEGEVKYGETETYETGRNYYPVQWEEDNGTVGESEGRNLIASNETTYKQASGDLVVTQTDYIIDIETAFKAGKTQISDNDFQIYYQLLGNNGSGNYWVASRGVRTYTFDSWCYYCLRNINNGVITSWGMMDSTKATYRQRSEYVRPIVSLPSSMINIDTGDGLGIDTAYGIN